MVGWEGGLPIVRHPSIDQFDIVVIIVVLPLQRGGHDGYLHRCVPCPIICVITKSSGRGAAINLGGRNVAGIVGDIGSRSDGGGEDVDVNAQGRTHGRL